VEDSETKRVEVKIPGLRTVISHTFKLFKRGKKINDQDDQEKISTKKIINELSKKPLKDKDFEIELTEILEEYQEEN
jgi:hypothetical protein